MKIGDIAEEALTAISTNKVRSGLTILGIVIGIASVIALTAVGQGSQASITARIESAGANLLTVSPGAQRSSGMVRGPFGGGTTLTPDDSDAISRAEWRRSHRPPGDRTLPGDLQLGATATSR